MADKNDKNKDPKKYEYSSDQIQVLEGLEPVRIRPGMYIGSTGQEGLHHLVTEIVNNSMDEAMAGFADLIRVVFHKDGSVAIYDNGRGIPYDIKKGYGVSALELAFTKLHAGGKFGGGGYKVSSGLHGVGASVVNALSKWCRVIVKRGDQWVIQEYINGGRVARPVEKLDPAKPITKIKDSKWTMDLKEWKSESGTIVQFMPDDTIFETTVFKFEHFINQLREYAYLTAGIRFELVDEHTNENYSFYFEGGIKAYLKALNRNKNTLNNTIFHAKKDYDDVNVEIALQYNDSFAETAVCFANHLKNSEGGTHLTGFRSALTKCVNDYARNHGLLKDKDPSLSGDDLREGLTAVISVALDSATLQFEGQTKAKLGNTNVRVAVENVVRDELMAFLEENPRDASAIVEKNILAYKARMAAKAARDTVIRKTALEGGGVLPGKLADCSSKDTAKTEIFIVEGDSAGGCFSGETQVMLLDGRNLSFAEIVKEQAEGKEHYCYTIRNDGKVGVERFINARITNQNAEVIKLTLDNGSQIVCTADHLFMLRDGSYRKAVELGVDDSIMPLNKDFILKKDEVNEAVSNFNHKVVNIETLKQTIPVYDAEVPETHNFALASGVFVHNSAKQGRDRKIQAILPLFGKVLNTERARLDKVIDSDKFKALIIAIGAGIGEQYNPDKLRYGKIIIMADADADGSHIMTLYLTFFFRHMPELIEKSHIYVAMPPLFKANWGKEKRYLFDDAERTEFLKTSNGQKSIIQRFKGLGEMNAEELWETTMNPATRKLKRIDIDDATKADEVFTMLMGDEVAPRKRFIQTHAKNANVDKQ